MIIDHFLEVERKNKLNGYEINGIHYWTYNRFKFWNYNICSENMHFEEAQDKEKLSFKTTLGLIYYSLFFKKTVHEKPVLVISHNRRFFNGTAYECVYTDDIIKDRYDAIFFEAPYQFKHLRPTVSKEIFYTDGIIINSILHIKLYKKFHKKEYFELVNTIKEQLSDSIEELKSVYNWSATPESVAKTCADTVVRCEYEKKKYSKLIGKIKPKVILEVVHYGRACMLINEIAKEMGITTVELQHGTMYKEHAAYQYSKGEKIKQLPDKLFAFSEFWKKCISLPIGDENIVVTGFPNFEKKLLKYSDSVRKDKRKTVIFISQGTVGKFLSELAAKTSALLDPSEYRLIYKLHPAEYSTWREDLPLLADSGMEVIDKRDIDLYELFAQSDIQIGAYSTALFEGMGFGVQTYIYNIGHYDIMLPLIEQGYAELVTSPEECAEKIKNSNSESIDGSMFWKRNALENIRKELDSIINKSEG